MSVKFQEKLQEEAASTVRHDTKELAHKIGDRLTGGKTQAGYLAVSALASTSPNRGSHSWTRLERFENVFADQEMNSALPAPTAIEPAAYQDVDLGCPLGPARIPRVLDRPRC